MSNLIKNEINKVLRKKGIYIIKETKSHQDYKITNEEFKIQITEHEKIEKITITNAPKEPERPKLPRTGF